MYRNYDGRNHQFGNTAIKAGTGNQGRLSIYAATRSSDGALTIMVVNKTHSTVPSTLSVKNFTGKSEASVYRYSSAHLTKIVKQASVSVHSAKIRTSFPGYSITLLVLPKR
jgi:O-glycosyl hydrolase